MRRRWSLWRSERNRVAPWTPSSGLFHLVKACARAERAPCLRGEDARRFTDYRTRFLNENTGSTSTGTFDADFNTAVSSVGITSYFLNQFSARCAVAGRFDLKQFFGEIG